MKSLQEGFAAINRGFSRCFCLLYGKHPKLEERLEGSSSKTGLTRQLSVLPKMSLIISSIAMYLFFSPFPAVARLHRCGVIVTPLSWRCGETQVPCQRTLLRFARRCWASTLHSPLAYSYILPVNDTPKNKAGVRVACGIWKRGRKEDALASNYFSSCSWDTNVLKPTVQKKGATNKSRLYAEVPIDMPQVDRFKLIWNQIQNVRWFISSRIWSHGLVEKTPLRQSIMHCSALSQGAIFESSNTEVQHSWTLHAMIQARWNKEQGGNSFNSQPLLVSVKIGVVWDACASKTYVYGITTLMAAFIIKG